MQIEIKGNVPSEPKARVLAIEATAKAICKAAGTDPADAVMMLMTAAAHLYSVHSGKPSSESLLQLARTLGHATAASDGFFRPRPVAANTDNRGEAR